MAVKSLYPLETVVAAGGDYGSIQDGGTAPTVANMVTGFNVGLLAPTRYADMDRGVEVVRGAVDATYGWITTIPANAPASARGNAFRTDLLNGSFANTAWNFSLGFRAPSGTAQRGAFRVRVYRSANADGSAATLIGAAAESGITSTASTTTVAQISASWTPGAIITLNNEYLFFVITWKITTTGSANASAWKIVAGSSVITTSDFTVAATPTFGQGSWRGRNDDGTEVTATWKAAENTNFTHPVDVNLRLRFVVQSATAAPTGMTLFRFQGNRNGGGWFSVSEATTLVRAGASVNVADQTSTTDQLGGTGTFNSGHIDAANGSAQGFRDATHTLGEHTEVEFVMQLRSADGVVAGDTFQFRVVYDAGGVINSYGTLPTVTVASVAVTQLFSAVSIVGSGAVSTGTPVKRLISAATIAGLSTTTAAPTVRKLSATAIAGKGTVTPAPMKVARSAATIAGTSTVTPAPQLRKFSQGVIAGKATVAASPLHRKLSSVGISGTSMMNAYPYVVIAPTLKYSAVSIEGKSTVVTIPTKILRSAATLAGTSTVTPAPKARKYSSAAIAGKGTLVPTPVQRKLSSALAAGSGTLTAVSRSRKYASVVIAGSGQMMIGGVPAATKKYSAVAIAGNSSLTVVPLSRRWSYASISGKGGVAATPQARKYSGASIYGTSSVAASPLSRKYSRAGMHGSSTLDALAVLVKRATVSMDGRATVTVAPPRTYNIEGADITIEGWEATLDVDSTLVADLIVEGVLDESNVSFVKELP